MYTYPVRVLLVDDHPIVQSGLSYELGRSAGLQIVCATQTVDESLTQLRQDAVDVVLSDLYLGDTTTGIQLMLQLRELGISLPVLIMSSDEKPATIRQVLGAGAAGFLSKRSTPADFEQAIRWAANVDRLPDPYIAPHDLRLRMHQLTTPPRPQQATQLQPLTRKEVETLRAFGQGLEPKEIAHERRVAVTTVYSQLNMAREKLQIHHDVELRNFAIRHLLE
ncbi:Transcriptional regulatory protein uhpA [Fibrella aestuarina BUZ 2]|uniref:Transcriptional regulatory protein uhpA n=1 Tax=Fibrella aestuarina BUZ 2 TaxID=1166018 RepID=I0K6H2_9BACT|nr:response regulator transcription factor [Fibrella aestuarina]CCG99725.1 Transcriptional regulatory protein uhpA [Fibrella aestuarina BUZ 2]